MTIAIIGILSSLLLGAASLSMGTARQARTESLVSRLHSLLSQHYDSFRDRRVEIKPGASGKQLAALRLLGTREQMKMELPDRWSDVTLESIPASPQAHDGSPAPINPTLPRRSSGDVADVPAKIQPAGRQRRRPARRCLAIRAPSACT